MMKRFFVLLFLFISYCSAMSQMKVVIGSSPMTTADVNSENMKKLLKKSYHLPYYPGDSIADTVLLKTVAGLQTKRRFFCVRYKNDTNKVAIGVEKLLSNSGYVITTYWNNKFKKRVTIYNTKFKMSGKYVEYYQKGWNKVTGWYKDGNKDGEWIYYDIKGDKFRKEEYSNGVLMPAPPSH